VSEFGLVCVWLGHRCQCPLYRIMGSEEEEEEERVVVVVVVVAGCDLDELTLTIYAGVRCSTDSEANINSSNLVPTGILAQSDS